MSTHNLCFGAKIRKIGIPLQTQSFYIKVGFKGVYFSQTCFPDVREGETKREEKTNTPWHLPVLSFFFPSLGALVLLAVSRRAVFIRFYIYHSCSN